MKLIDHVAAEQKRAEGLNRSQRALIAVRLKNDFRMLKPSLGRTDGKHNSTKAVAELMGLSTAAIHEADQLLRFASDDLVAEVEQGKLSLSKALARVGRVRKPRLQELLRCWRLCSESEQREFAEKFLGKISETINPELREAQS